MYAFQPQPLAPYAADAAISRRLVEEPECGTRSPFQRDRDRIIHSAAFRRLEYKTQVFVNHEGDHYRTRLTHSLEVAQIARSMCRALRLNEDLAEALALAHDLGHTPFGHAGEDGLSEAMEAFGGFDHNAQTLRIVTQLEHRYAEFDGLNLTWDTLEGIAKHNGPVLGQILGQRQEAGGKSEVGIGTSSSLLPPASGLLPRALAEYNAAHDLQLHTHASLEAQVAALADDIAYNNHDIDDGLRAGLFSVEDLQEVPEVYAVFEEVQHRHPLIAESRLIHEALRRLINRMCSDLLETTTANIGNAHVRSVDEVRLLGRTLVEFSPGMQEVNLRLKAFLTERMYRHYKVNRMSSKARSVVRELFEFFLTEPDCLPTDWRVQTGDVPGTQETAEVVCDFIAGMTDRFALNEYRRIFEVTER